MDALTDVAESDELLAAAVSGDRGALRAAAAATARRYFTEGVADKLLSGGVQGARRLLLSAFERHLASTEAAPSSSGIVGSDCDDGDDHSSDGLLADPLARPAVAIDMLLAHTNMARANFEKECARIETAAHASAASEPAAATTRGSSISAELVSAWGTEVERQLLPTALSTLGALLQAATEERQLRRQQARAAAAKAAAISEAREGLLRQRLSAEQAHAIELRASVATMVSRTHEADEAALILGDGFVATKLGRRGLRHSRKLFWLSGTHKSAAVLCWRSLTKAERGSEQRASTLLRRRKAQESRATQTRIRALRRGGSLEEDAAGARDAAQQQQQQQQQHVEEEDEAGCSPAPSLRLGGGSMSLRPVGGVEGACYELLDTEGSAEDPEASQSLPVQLLLESQARDSLRLQGAACQAGYAAAAAGGGGIEGHWARRRALHSARTAAALELTHAQEAADLELAEAEARAAAAGDTKMQYIYDETRGLGDEAVTAVIGKGVHLWIASTLAEEVDGDAEEGDSDSDDSAATPHRSQWEAKDVERRRLALEAKFEAGGEGEAGKGGAAVPAETPSRRLSAAAFKRHVASVRESQERARAKARARVEGRSRVITLEFDCTATRDTVLNALQMLIHVQQRETFQELEPIMGTSAGLAPQVQVRRGVYPFLVRCQGEDMEGRDIFAGSPIPAPGTPGVGARSSRGRSATMLPLSGSTSAGGRNRPLQRRRSSRLRERIHREGDEHSGGGHDAGRGLPLNLADFRRHSWADSRTIAPESLPFSTARKESANRVRIAGHARPGSINTMRRHSQLELEAVEQAEREVAAALSGYVEPDSPSVADDDCEL